MSQGYNKLSSADSNAQQNIPDLIDQDEYCKDGQKCSNTTTARGCSTANTY
ncbi:unnamed protein product [Debaryomyces tyrocola]|nr:unnamed protein product [Debaryomyces tyrocola]